MGRNRIDDYLAQCHVQPDPDGSPVRVPPTPMEARELIANLQERGLEPAIVGSVAVFYHLKVKAHEYRGTADLDIWVNSAPGQPIPGWRVDTASPGVLSWISPSGGYVDFMVAGQVFPDGTVTPQHIAIVQSSEEAEAIDLLKLKLDTWRERDLSDSISLCRSLGRIPGDDELGVLSDLQRENLTLVRLWLNRLAEFQN